MKVTGYIRSCYVLRNYKVIELYFDGNNLIEKLNIIVTTFYVKVLIRKIVVLYDILHLDP